MWSESMLMNNKRIPSSLTREKTKTEIFNFKSKIQVGLISGCPCGKQKFLAEVPSSGKNESKTPKPTWKQPNKKSFVLVLLLGTFGGKKSKNWKEVESMAEGLKGFGVVYWLG